MASTIAPPLAVTPPAVSGRRYGLYSVANMRDEADLHWQVGVEWEALRGGLADAVEHGCLPQEGEAALVPAEGVDTVEAVPLVVVGSYSCPAAGRGLDDARQRAEQHLLAGEERAVERALAVGDVGNTPHLGEADELAPAAAVGLVEAVGLLEGWLAVNSHSAGALYGPAQLGAWVSQVRAAERVGDHLETLAGSRLALGGGFDQAVEEDGDLGADEVWLWASARPQVWRSPVFVPDDEQAWMWTDTNVVTVFAQRTVVVAFDGEPVKVRVEVS